MSLRQRVFLNPSSHSANSSRFVLSGRGAIDCSSLHLEVFYDGTKSELDAVQWYPRAGAFALIDTIQILRNGAEISYLNNVGQFAAIKSMTVKDEKQLSAKTKGALALEVPKVGNGFTTSVQNNAELYSAMAFTTYPQYDLSWSISNLSNSGNPLLPLSFVMQIFERNNILNLNEDKYEIIIDWAQSNTFIGTAGSFKINGNTRLIFETSIDPEVISQIPTVIMPWREIRSSTYSLPKLDAIGTVPPPGGSVTTSDSQLIPLRLSNFDCDAVIVQFTASTTAAVWGNGHSVPFCIGDYEYNLIVNDNSLYSKPITQESMRLYHLGRALSVFSNGREAGGDSVKIPAMTNFTYTTDKASAAAGTCLGDPGGYYRGGSQLMAPFITNVASVAMCSPFHYLGFDLRNDGLPTFLNQSGLFLQLIRSGSVYTIPPLTVTAFAISLRS